MTLRRTILSLQLALSCAVLAPGLARADWAYTRWGMTPEQVAAASGGQVKVLPAGERTRDDDDEWEVAAQGRAEAGGQRLGAGFMFGLHKDGLKCVMLNGTGPAADALKSDATARYGKPEQQSEFPGGHGYTWTTPERIELVTADAAHTAAITICRPGED
jgi:hypothetical protein